MIIINVPHSSIKIPEEHLGDFVLSGDELDREAKIMADLHVDKLVENIDEDKIVFPYSRVVCDVERFRDDVDEDMAGIGMGVVYKVTHDLKKLRKEGDCENIKRELYDPYHEEFSRKVGEKLEKFGRCFILDVHSYADKALEYEMNKDDERSDFDLGFDEFHIDKRLVLKIRKLIESKGYSAEFNKPFSGAIVPLEYYGKEKRVSSLMLEINKRTYLDGFRFDEEKGKRVSGLIREIVELIRGFL